MSENRLHICFFSGDITNSGGTERVGTIIASQLAEKTSNKISIISLTNKKEKLFFDINENIELNHLFSGDVKALPRILIIWMKLIKFVKKTKVDVIVDIDGILEMYSLPVKVITGVKVISWEHYSYHYHPHVTYRKYTRRMAARWADAIVTITKSDRDEYLKNLSLKCPIYQIYNPMVIYNNENQKYNVESKLIISAGRMSREKGFDYLVEVANLVLKKHKDWKWEVLGDGEERELLEAKIAEYGIQDQLILSGNVNNIDCHYNKAAIYVMTSRHEGFGLVLTEAKVHKLPCVSFDCNVGPKEIILDGINGFLVECFDIEKMAERINELIENTELRQRFSENSLKDTEKYSLKTVVQQWITVFEELEKNGK